MQDTYAASTVRSAHTVLHAALEQAVRWNLLARNPSDHVSLPQVVGNVQIWSEAEAQQFLIATAQSRDHALWRLYLDTGMRVGEALALAWDDVDLDAGHVRIHRTISRDADERQTIVERTKTGAGRRVALAPATVASLRAHRAAQNLRRLAAPVWEATGLVFDRGDGHHTHNTVIRARFIKDCERAGVPVIQLKALRHTAATIMVANGLPLHTVSKRLGHSTIRLTADLYAHASPDADRAASVLMERIFGDACEQDVITGD
jgi:integrase